MARRPRQSGLPVRGEPTPRNAAATGCDILGVAPGNRAVLTRYGAMGLSRCRLNCTGRRAYRRRNRTGGRAMPSDDSFTVYVQNLTGGAMNPSSSTLEYGEFSDGGNPVSIAPWSSGSVPQAFAVEGKIADGPQGTVIYNINDQVNMIVQFNSNLGGNSYDNGGDYFYAGLQPSTADADTSGVYLQIQNFSMPTGEG